MKLRSKISLLVFCPFILQVAILFEISHLLFEAEAALNKQIEVTRIQFLSSSLQKELGQCLSFAFMYRISGKEEYSERLKAALKDFSPLAEKLYDKLKAANYDPGSLATLRQLVDKTVNMGNQILVDDPTSRFKAERIAYMKTSLPTMKALSEEGGRIDSFAQSLNRDPEEASKARERVVNFIYLAFAADLLLALGLGIAFIKDIVNRIGVVRQNTLQFSLNQPLKKSVSGNDEIAELDNFFRMMTVSLEDSNKRQKALVENTADILCSIDKEGKFVSVNAAAKKIWGFEPDALLGQSIFKTIRQTDVDEVRKQMQLAVSSPTSQTFDCKTVTAGGTESEMRWSVIWSETDKALFCVVRDVSRENELARMKQALMDTAAHDLRAPLTAMVATLSNLAMGVLGPLSDDVKSRIEKTEKQAKRLVKLVSDLLDNEALTTGRLTYVKENVKLKPIIQDSIASLQSIAERKNLSLVIDVSESTTVIVDKDRIAQVFVNMISNAIKYSNTGGSVGISVAGTGGTHYDQSSDFVRIEIIDNGVGIDDTRKASVFERFANNDQEKGNAQVKELKGDQQASTGLGLSIAKKIVEDHGGQIGVADTPGGGATFWFTLPKD